MTALTVTAVILAAGWVFVRQWLRTRYMALKESGHPQYFAAAVAGVCLLAFGASIHAWARETFLWYPDAVRRALSILPQLHDAQTGPDPGGLISLAAAATLALVLATCLPWLFNLPVLRSRALLRATMKRANAFDAVEHLYAHALDCGLPIAVTLKNRKVYVGAPIASSTMDIDKKWLILIPILSGFRNEESQLSLPVSYERVGEVLMEQNPEEARKRINEFLVVLPFSEIVSMQTFNIVVYYDLFKADSADEAVLLDDGETTNGVQATTAEAEDTMFVASDSTGQADWPQHRSRGDDFSDDERQRLFRYNGYVLLLGIATLALPYSPIASLVGWGVAGLFGIAATTEPSEPA